MYANASTSNNRSNRSADHWLQQRCPIRLCRKPNPLRRLFWSRNVCSILIRRPYLPCAKYAVREQNAPFS